MKFFLADARRRPSRRRDGPVLPPADVARRGRGQGGRVSEVDARIGYAARRYAMDGVDVAPAGVVVLQTPRDPAGGIALPVEDGRWLVGAISAPATCGRRATQRASPGSSTGCGTTPSRSSRAPAPPRGTSSCTAKTGNRRHHYERVRDWPPGLLVVGDALCAFNPVYGQGVTVAACEALVLRDALRSGSPRGTSAGSCAGSCGSPRCRGRSRRAATSATPRIPRPSPLQALLGRWTQELDRLDEPR